MGNDLDMIKDWMSTLVKGYRIFIMAFFLVTLIGVLSIGRPFSVYKLFGVLDLPFYVTDVFILLALPLALVGMAALMRTPKAFFWPFWALLLMGACYLAWGLCIERNGFVFRGVVLSSYLLFLPLVWVLFARKISLERFLAILVFCNMLSVMFGLGFGPQVLEMNMREFNLALYYTITLSFLLAYGMECVQRDRQWFVWLLVVINVYMILTSSVRSAWVAFACLIAFYVFVTWPKIMDLVKTGCVVAFLVALLIFIQPPGIPGGEEGVSYVRRMEGTMLFLNKIVDPNGQVDKKKEVSSEAQVAYSNIVWRLKVWKATWNAAMTSPVWGHGFSQVLVYDDSITTNPVRGFADNSGITPPHNEFLTIFYKMGFLGLALFLWINGFVFFQGVRALRRFEQGMHRACLIGALGGLVVWHAMAQFFDVIDSPPTSIFLWMLLGLVLVLVYGQKARSVQEAT